MGKRKMDTKPIFDICLLSMNKNRDPDDSKIWFSCGISICNQYALFPNIINTEDNNSKPMEWLENGVKITTRIRHFDQLKSDDKLGTINCTETLEPIRKHYFQQWHFEQPIWHNLFIFRLTPNGTLNDFYHMIYANYNFTSTRQKGDPILVQTCPFGQANLIGTIFKGIISNIIVSTSDSSRNLILADCPLTPGTCGSPVYTIKGGMEVFFGIVYAPICFWKGIWTGLSVVLDLESIFSKFFDCTNYSPLYLWERNLPVVSKINSCLLQIDCCNNSQWGTAILLDKTTGLLLTNSHVITTENNNDPDVDIYWMDHRFKATIIFKVPPPQPLYDLALIQIKHPSELDLIPHLESVQFANVRPELGQTVYAAGYPFFPTNLRIQPTVTHGHVVGLHLPNMLMTSCCVNAGMSGGGVFNTNGKLVGVIVCNTRIDQSDVTYFPRFNMAIPIVGIAGILLAFIKTKDKSVLQDLIVRDNQRISQIWNPFRAIVNHKL